MKVHCVIKNYFKVWKITRPWDQKGGEQPSTIRNEWNWTKTVLSILKETLECMGRGFALGCWQCRLLINKVGVAGSLPLQKVIIRALMVFLESCVFFSCLDMSSSQRQTSSGLKRHDLWATKVNTSWKRAAHYQKPLQSQKIMRRWGHTVLLTSWGREGSSWVKSFLTHIYYQVFSSSVSLWEVLLAIWFF